jgi:hypothetical protein
MKDCAAFEDSSASAASTTPVVSHHLRLVAPPTGSACNYHADEMPTTSSNHKLDGDDVPLTVLAGDGCTA